MKTTGYILDGVYYANEEADISQLKTGRTATDKIYDHDKQRRNHRRDLIQPYDAKGKPNPEFIREYPEESKTYGFIKE